MNHYNGARLRLTVIGCGYLGITHAACMASLGFQVLGVDISQARVMALNAGRLPITEPGLGGLLAEGLAAGRLAFTTSYDDAAQFGDVHFVCTGTPSQPGRDDADLTQVTAAVTALGERVTRRSLIVGKSTVLPGTARQLGRFAGPHAEIAWNPEFLREGIAVADTLRPPRIVVGVTSAWAEMQLARIYAGPVTAGAAFIVTGLETAELAKTAANAYLAARVSFINTMAEVCDVAGADIRLLTRVLAADPRIGGEYLTAGLGFGGGCLPKDLRALAAWSEHAGVPAGLLRAVDEVNLRARQQIINLAVDLAGGDLAGVRVCVLGAAFKPGTDDVRDSPALATADALHSRGAIVTVCDPAGLGNARRACPHLFYTPSPFAAAAGAQVVLLATGWPQFTGLDPDEVGGVVAARNIIDGRHALDPYRWITAGWVYRAPGSPVPEPADGAGQAVP